MNRKRLLNECHKNEKGIQTPKTKTAHIIPELMTDTYKREPQEDIVQCTKHEWKSLIIARFGMLECGRNFKGSLNELCNQCHQIDDKNHRLNYCIKYYLGQKNLPPINFGVFIDKWNEYHSISNQYIFCITSFRLDDSLYSSRKRFAELLEVFWSDCAPDFFRD